MASTAFSQTADVTGKVTDKDGGALPGATVAVKNKGTGIERRVVTDKGGSYKVPALVPGEYKLKVNLSGFADTERDATIYIGQDVRLDFKLELATFQAQVTVTGEAPLVKTEESDLSTVINEQDIDNLPLNGRTFQNLAILVPGATQAENFDPTKTRLGAISINGQIGRSSQVSIDGGDNNDDTVGGILQQYSAESIQEFEVITNRFKAEYGQSAGGVISVITKSGTNEFHGDVFGYYRGKSLNSKDYFEKKLDLPKADFKRLQYGVTFGGPIVKDRTHFFAAFERQEEDVFHIVDTNGIWPQYEGTVKQPFRQDLFTAKVNHTLTDNQFLTFRYGYEKNHRDGDQLEFCGATCAASAAAIQNNKLWSALINHTWIATQSVLNEFAAQYQTFHNNITGASKYPAQHFPNLVIGANSQSDQTTNQKSYQFKDDFSLHAEHHDWKAGVAWKHEPELGGSFAFLTHGAFYYSVDDPNAPATYFFTFAGDATLTRQNDQVGVYVQDDWSATDRLVLNLGLRYDVEFGTFDVPETVISDAIANNPAGRRYAGIKRSKLQNDVDNIAPRLGFAWDLMGNGKTVARGGWGLFYDQVFYNITLFDDFLHNDPPFVGVGIGSPTFGPGNIPDLTPYLIPQNALMRYTSPDLETPYSWQASLGISQQIGNHLAFDADLVANHGYKEFRRRDINIADENGIRHVDPNLGTIRMVETTGWSWYRGLQVALRGRWKKFGTQISGSIADAKTNHDEFFSRPCYEPRDNAPDNTNCDTGKPENLERYRLVVSGIYQLPADFQVSGIVQYGAARPWTTYWGYNRNGDPTRTNDRPGHLGNNYGDPTFTTDLRFAKFFKFTKSMNLEASVDIFNIFDTVNFGGGNSGDFGTGNGSYDGRLQINSTTPNPNYGQPTKTFTNPRQIQLGLRFNF